MADQIFRNYRRRFLLRARQIANLHEDSDVDATIAGIRKDIEFRGANLWVLAFAIIVASVGLNVNSTAVIIGAMLISPLMGPISGIGLAIGTNDFELLRKSLNNLVIMVLISLAASTAYFIISPLSDAQSELLARTTPTIFDVFIALFGGLAGIVARSRKGGNFTVIAGVAIATALMPPLCTAGFGLATLQLHFFFGAFYLFFINSFFIALATFIIVRYLRFPHKVFIDPLRERRVKRSIFFFSILTIAPSIFLAFNVVRETSFNSKATRFIDDLPKNIVLNDTYLIQKEKQYRKKQSTITLTLLGKPLAEDQIALLNNKLPDYGLTQTRLVVKQSGKDLHAQGQRDTYHWDALFIRTDRELQKKDSLILALKQQLQQQFEQRVSMDQLAREIGVEYPGVRNFALSNALYIQPGTLKKDTVPTLILAAGKEVDRNKLSQWLKVRLQIERLIIKEQAQ